MNTLRTRVFRSLAWQGAGKIIERVVRFAVNIVLARLLAPDDFGTFAALLLPLAVVDAVSFLACGPFIIHSEKGSDPRFLRTVFTVNNIRGVGLSIILLPMAFLFARYFDHPELTPLFLVAAIQPMLAGFESPGIHVLAKELLFARIAVIRVLAALFGALMALIWAIYDPSPWALLVGQLVGVATAMAGTWVLAPVQPGWGIDREAWRALRTFALKAAGTPLFIMLVMQAPALLLGRMESLNTLGIFSMSARLAELPVYLTLTVAGSVLIPAYSVLQHDQDRLRRAWLKAWTGIAFVCAPIALLLAWMGDALPGVVWGAEYVSPTPLMPILALCGLLSSLLAVTGPLFWGVGRPSIDRAMQAARVAVVFLLGVVLTREFQGAGLAWSLAVGLFAALAIACPCALRIVGARPRQLALASLPGAAAALLLAVPLVFVELLVGPSGWVRVVIAGGIAVVFAVTVGAKALNSR